MRECIIKQQIHKLLRITGNDTIFPAHICKSRPHLYKELRYIADESLLQILFVILLIQC